jgi:hypothetical protein
MIWEFGELGYDYSINYCPNGTVNSNCRLDPKPIRWDYQNVPLRKRVYDVVRALIKLRQLDAFKNGTMEMSVINQFEKKLRIRHADMDIVVAGNFNVADRNIAPVFTKTGWWYDYLSGDSLLVDNQFISLPFTPGEYHVWTSKKVNLDFEIATSNKEIISIAPLMIYPSLNDGQFYVQAPEGNEKFNIEIISTAGQSLPFDMHNNGKILALDMSNPIADVYIVKLI